MTPPKTETAPTGRHLAPILTAGIGLVAALGSFQLARHVESVKLQAEFERRAEARHGYVREALQANSAALFGLRNLFVDADGVTRQEFQTAALEVSRRYPITTLEWVPVVTAADRAAVEAEASRQLGRPFVITERDASGQLVPAGPRAEYLPILYLAPSENQESVYGYDVGTSPNHETLDAARASHDLRISPQIHLIQETDPDKFGLVWVCPVYRFSGDQEFAGYVQAVFRLEDMFTRSGGAQASYLDALFLDLDAPPARRVMACRLSGEQNAESGNTPGDFLAGIHIVHPLEIGGRHWQVIYRPGAGWVDRQSTQLPLVILAAMLAVTGLASWTVHTQQRHTREIEELVAHRTAELRSREEELRGILDHSPSSIFVKDLDGRYTMINHQFARIMGLRPSAILGRTDHELYDPDNAARYVAADRQTIETRQPIQLEDTSVLDGKAYTHLVSKFALLDAHGHVRGVCGIATDITDRAAAAAERKAVETKILETQKLESLGVLAGGIAHDFNNLLTAILGHAGLIESALPPDSPLRPQIGQIERTAHRAADLCQQMLAYSGGGRFILEQLDLNALIRDTLELLHSSLSKQATLELQLAPGLPAVHADATQLRQILMNLAINATEALDGRPGNVRVRTAVIQASAEHLRQAVHSRPLPAGTYVSLEVEDDGIGMSADTLARIFEPFFTTKFAGRGLGLAAVLGIVQSHDGALFVHSRPGQGTRFELLLPASAQPAPVAPAAPASPAVARPPRALRILLADDEEPVRFVAATMLEHLGCTVTPVGDGLSAVHRFTEEPDRYDLVLLDLTMPEMNGDEVLRHLRTIRPEIRVVMMSGFSEEDASRRFGSHAPDAFLQKPFSLETINSTLARLFA